MKAASEGPISLVSAPSDGAEEDWAAELTERHFPLPWIVEELEAASMCATAPVRNWHLSISRRSPAGERQQNC